MKLENHPNAKLTNEEVIWLRNNYKEHKHKSNIKELSKKLGICVSNARNIVRGRYWSDLKSGIKPPKKHLTPEQKKYIKDNYKCSNYKSNAGELADKFNVTKCTIFYIVSGRIGLE